MIPDIQKKIAMIYIIGAACLISDLSEAFFPCEHLRKDDWRKPCTITMNDVKAHQVMGFFGFCARCQGHGVVSYGGRTGIYRIV